MKKDFDYFEELLYEDQLPEGFNQWLMSNKEGQTLAHLAIQKGNFPSDWTNNKEDRLIKDNNGDTIAHFGELIPDWTDCTEDWLIKDSCGETIAEIAAKKNNINPQWTNKAEDWLISNSNELNTVAHYAANNNTLPVDWTDNKEHWKIKNIHNETISFLYSKEGVFHNNPKTLIDYSDNIKNHIFPLLNNSLNSTQLCKISFFINPLLPKISDHCDKGDILKDRKFWLKSSDEYQGYLIEEIKNVTNKLVDLGSFKISEEPCFNSLVEINEKLKNKKHSFKEQMFKHRKDSDSYCFLNELDI